MKAKVPSWESPQNRGLVPVLVVALLAGAFLAQIQFATPGNGWQAESREHAVYLWFVGKPAEAARYMRRAIALAPQDAESQRLLGMMAFSFGEELMADGEPAKAKRYFLEAQTALARSIRIAPARAESHYAMGLILKRTGERAPALQEFQQCLELTGTRRDDLKRRAIFRLAEFGEFVEKPLPPSPIAELCERGRRLLGKGQLEEAGRFAQKAIAVDATDPEAWELYGEVCSEQGETSAARKALSMAWAHKSDGQPMDP